jgi:hypothetical protein
MGFGTLAVLGVQTSLRLNADIAKQRNEALRIAQEQLERARAFDDMDAYRDDIVTGLPAAAAGYATANASYLFQVEVESPAGENAPQHKNLVVTVSWTDRANEAQTLQLRSVVHGVPPALPGSLALPGNTGPVRNPAQRHYTIPRAAVTQAGGQTSHFTPPGAVDVQWVFSNDTGVIIERCLAGVCTPFDARLLAGYIRFATAVASPGVTDAELPPGTLMPVEVRVDVTDPSATVLCYETDVLGSRAYYCAVPVNGLGLWSGRTTVTGLAPLATGLADANAAAYRVCRYTPYRDSHPTVPTQMRNEENPLDYVGVRDALINQNFLVIKAGDGTLANDCPADGPAPQLNTNTWHHQPAS